MPTRYFRAGIGSVIFNQEGAVAFFERKKEPVGIWQFQQGGIDLNETVDDALWRELREEIGLEKNAVDVLGALPNWYLYEDMDAASDTSIQRIGQAHRWFFLKLRPHHTIDLTLALDDEFNDWKWISFEEAIAVTSPHKRHVYEHLYRHYQNHL
jgi:putative (di)nucleoside polyphosphate hydrolase